MDEKNHKSVVDQEVDVFLLFNSLGNFFKKLLELFFRVLNFLQRNFIVTIVIIVVSLALGYFVKENSSKSYKHEVIVAPNFNSIEYLYNRIDKFNDIEEINSIEIAPIIDVYDFISDKPDNINVGKFLADNSLEISKYTKSNNIQKLYRYHKITYYTKVKDIDNKLYTALINVLNDNEYYKEVQKIRTIDTKYKLSEYEKTVENINNLFQNLGSDKDNLNKNVSVQMFSELSDVLENKTFVLDQITKAKVTVFEESKVIYDVTKQLNINNKKGILYLLIYPIVSLLLFIVFNRFLKKYGEFRSTLKK